MKRRLLFLIAVYAGFMLLFALQKPLFMLYQGDIAAGIPAADWFRVILHGMLLDISVAGYSTVLPWLLVMISVWIPGRWLVVSLRVYFLLFTFLLALIFAGDMALYPFWRFRLDATVLFYLQSPADAMASIPPRLFWTQIAVLAVWWAASYLLMRKIVQLLADLPPVRLNRAAWSGLFLLLGGVLFLSIRGGVTQATANVGKVYFSRNMFLNHAAINPAFSLFESITKEHNFSRLYPYFDEEKRARLFAEMCGDPTGIETLMDSLLATSRPDIVLVVLESFTSNILEERVDGQEVTPRFNALKTEGVWFPNFYGNSFRTDRGLVSILNGYPAQPTTSIMKYPSKSQTLPSIAQSLDSAGYVTSMLYGGDINFTNMRSYFYASGYYRVTGEQDMRLAAPRSEWGYNDSVMFVEFRRRLEEQQRPFFATFLTLSSHEPFDVPGNRFENKVLNSMAFADEHLGRFVDSLKSSPLWDNLLLILVADHALTWPETLRAHDIDRHHIPMLWLGGALREAKTVDRVASQIDIAATLLAQLGLSYDEFAFSKNLFDSRSPEFAFYTFNNGFGIVDRCGATVWDCDSETMLDSRGADSLCRERILKGKAMLQTLYEDLDKR